MKIKTFEVNGRKFKAKEVDTNALCVFEDAGLTINDIARIEKKTFSFVRAYVAFCGDMDIDAAGNLVNEHLCNGGELNEVMEVFGEALKESRFFQALTKTAEKKNTATEK